MVVYIKLTRKSIRFIKWNYQALKVVMKKKERLPLAVHILTTIATKSLKLGL